MKTFPCFVHWLLREVPRRFDSTVYPTPELEKLSRKLLRTLRIYPRSVFIVYEVVVPLLQPMRGSLIVYSGVTVVGLVKMGKTAMSRTIWTLYCQLPEH